MADELEIRKELQRWLDQLRQSRQSYIPYWQDVKDYICPARGRFLGGEGVSEVDNGERNDKKIINSVGTKALEIMSSGMQSGLTSKARPWFALGNPDPDLNNYAPVQQYLKLVVETLTDAFARSNVYNVFLDVYSEMGAFGPGPMVLLEHPTKNFYARSYTAGTYWLSSNNHMEVDAMFVMEYMTARQMAQEYGVERLSSAARSAYDQGQYEQKFKVIIAFLKYPVQGLGIELRSNMTSAAVHFEEGGIRANGSDGLLAIRPYRSFPVMAPRWNTIDTDVYGWSPSRMIIGNIKMSQQMERDKLQGLGKLVSPPMQGPPELERRGINASPGGYTAVSGNSEQGIRPLYQVQPDIRSLQSGIDRVVQDIKEGYFNDLFMAIRTSDINRRAMMAQEVLSRNDEAFLILGPVLERIHYELLDPLIDRAIQILYFNGRIPAPPPELIKSPPSVEYISILSQAQKAVSVGRIEKNMGFIGQMVGVWPQMKEMVDDYAVVAEYAKATGLQPGMLRSREDYQRIVQQQNAQTQMAQQAKIANDLASGAKTISEADPSTLSGILGSLTGADNTRMIY